MRHADGGPAWLPNPEGARWTRVEPVGYPPPGGGSWAYFVGDGPGWLPRLKRDQSTRTSKPPLHETQAQRVRFVAWALDFGLRSQADLARILYGMPRLTPDSSDDEIRRAQTCRRQISRDRKAGRAGHAIDGVLPWAAWPDGDIPDGWWREPMFGEAVDRWQAEAVARYPAPSERPALREHLHQALDAVAAVSNVRDRARQVADTMSTAAGPSRVDRVAVALYRESELARIKRDPWQFPSDPAVAAS